MSNTGFLQMVGGSGYKSQSFFKDYTVGYLQPYRPKGIFNPIKLDREQELNELIPNIARKLWGEYLECSINWGPWRTQVFYTDADQLFVSKALFNPNRRFDIPYLWYDNGGLLIGENVVWVMVWSSYKNDKAAQSLLPNKEEIKKLFTTG